MELPHIGTHCSEPACNQLDFLPFTCNLCKKEFCVDHHTYTAHNCTESYKADVQVPICPLCDQPVPSKRGEAPDLAVNDHMENNCRNKKKKIYTNKCSVQGCKVKEMIPVKCESCHMNYCLRHRHTTDHECRGPMSSRERALAAAEARNKSKQTTSGNSQRSNTNGILKYLTPLSGRPRPTGHSQPVRSHGVNVSSIQGGMTEDEALARAMAASMQEANGSATRDEQPRPRNSDNEDELLAQAIAASLEQNQQANSSRNSCNVC